MAEIRLIKTGYENMLTGIMNKDAIFFIPSKEDFIKLIFISEEKKEEIIIDSKYKKAGVFIFKVKNNKSNKYILMSGEKYIKDEYARLTSKADNSYLLPMDAFSWKGEKKKKINFNDLNIYRLHVGGFTKHNSSEVENKGTFKGILEKKDYLREIGVNAILLMPAYEFFDDIKEGSSRGKTNYWGYGDAHFFAPKEGFSSEKSGGQMNEFKKMVYELNKSEIEVFMEFYFPQKFNPHTILDVLRYWVLEYHIDGIHIACDNLSLELIRSDYILKDIKIIYNSWDNFSNSSNSQDTAVYNDEFLISARRFVRGDENSAKKMSEVMVNNNPYINRINYLATHDSLRLFDSVSFISKKNEDGRTEEFSQNLGFEGLTKKKKILSERVKQIKNMLTLLYLSQGAIMIYAGDEMGKTQLGNNNPYSLDNEISWIDWNDLIKNKEIFEYIKSLSKLRKDHTMLRKGFEIKMADYLEYNIPDISLHSREPWKSDYSENTQEFCILYNGKYGRKNEKSLYAIFNMNELDEEFYIPNPNKNLKWNLILSTDSKNHLSEDCKMAYLKGRSISILEG